DGEEPPRRHRRGQAPRRVRRHRPGRFSGQGTGRGTRPSRRVTVNNRLSTTCSRGSRSGANVTPVLRPCRSTGKKHPQGTPTIGFPPTETLLSPQVRSVGSFRVHLPGRSRWPNPLPSTPTRTPMGDRPRCPPHRWAPRPPWAPSPPTSSRPQENPMRERASHTHPAVPQPVSVALALVLVTTACSAGETTAGEHAPEGELVVFAAASLLDVFEELAEEFEAEHPGVEVTFNFAGSSELAVQINSGAPADVLATANTHTMAQVVEEGGLDKEWADDHGADGVVFAVNTLQIAV